MKQLRGGDSLWFSVDTENAPMHITQVTIYDPGSADWSRMTLDRVKRYVARRIDGLPLHRKLVRVPLKADYPYWVEDGNFDLGNHIFQTKLGERGNWSALLAAVGEIAEVPLDYSRPLWEMHLITGLGRIKGLPKGAFGIALKVHHGQFDGTTLKKLVARLHAPARGENGGHWTPEPDPSSAELLARAVWNRPRWAWHTAYVVGKNLPRLLATLRNSGEGGSSDTAPGENPRTRFSHSIATRERVFDALEFPLPDIKAMRRAVDGATVNDVALAIVGGALRRYLAAHGELPEEPLTIIQPVSAHEEDESEETGNRTSAMAAVVHTEIDDPVQRLALVRESTKRAKQRSQKVGPDTVADLVDVLPTNLLGVGFELFVKSGLADRLSMGSCGVSLTNVPGSAEAAYFDGARMVRSIGVGFLVDGMGLLLVATSYGETFSLQFVSSPDVMPDPGFFTRCLREGFQELQQAR
jgi:WS/DGAT/MGAT family acyltransferase